ncbi:MAG: hypothetical protein Q8O38_16030 [Sulfurimicrobium sp.]|nr:hypothetical protein [Sulfurimicrobium sp.]
MNTLVTGATGYIGTNFVLGWLAQSDETVTRMLTETFEKQS